MELIGRRPYWMNVMAEGHSLFLCPGHRRVSLPRTHNPYHLVLPLTLDLVHLVKIFWKKYCLVEV